MSVSERNCAKSGENQEKALKKEKKAGVFKGLMIYYSNV